MTNAKASPEGHAYFRKLHETPAFGATDFDFEGLRQGMATRRPPIDPAVQCIPVDAGGVPGEWVVAPNADPDRRMLYLHGGGYISGSAAYYLQMGARLSAACQAAVLLIDYRLAPEHPFPAGIEDCIASYLWMIEHSPKQGLASAAPASQLIIAGDSAGGGLTLATMLSLRDRNLPTPSCGIPLSPFTDLTLSGESIVSEGELDPIMHPRCLPDFVTRYAKPDEYRHPLASPVFADYADIAPLQIHVGEHEIIRDDSTRVAASAQRAGVDVTLKIWPGMFHVFTSHEPLLPEAAEAIAQMGEFVQRFV